MIQLYIKRADLIRSESELDTENIEYNDFVNMILEEGIKDCLNIRPDGYILRGNTRTQAAGDLDIGYLPVFLKSFLGLFVNSDGSDIRLRTSIIDYYINSKEHSDQDYMMSHPVIPNRKDTELYLVNPIQYEDDYSYYKLIRRDET